MSDATKKLSMVKSIGFRPGSSFREQVDKLSEASGWRVSDIMRIGVQAFWPDISALVLASGNHAPDDPSELRAYIELSRRAQEHGVDIRKALTEAIEAKLASQAA